MNKSLNLNENINNSTTELKQIDFIQFNKPNFKSKTRLINKFSTNQKYKTNSLLSESLNKYIFNNLNN